MAVRGIKWPGVANLVVSLVSIHRGAWTTQCQLDGKPAGQINAFFEAQGHDKDPTPLIENKSQIFEGYKFLGEGFLLSHEEADSMIRERADNSEVIQPVINGDELNNHPTQAPGRKIINFVDRPLEKAQKFSAPIERVERLVKPVRANDNRQLYRDNWWIFGENRPGLRRGLANLKGCFVVARTTKHLSFSLAPINTAFTDALKVFTTDRWDHYAVVQSTIHEVWSRKYSGALGATLRYSPSDCFETFAFPVGQWQHPNPDLAAIGERYHEYRRDLMLRLWLGLTDIYNLFHAPDLDARLDKLFNKRAKTGDWHRAENVPPEHRATAGSLTQPQARDAIHHLRDLHRQLDQAVLTAYAWHEPGSDGPAIHLGHDFQQVETLPENDRTRYTILPKARKDLLTRLLKLNHQRAAEEAAKVPAKATKTAKPQRAKQSDELL
jgi:hypothetical protein